MLGPVMATHHKKKVWLTEESIVAAIDRATARLLRDRKRSAELDRLKRKCQRIIAKPKGKSLVQACLDLEACQNDLARINKHARSLEDNTLPRLKRTLAAFRTQTLEFMGDYKGVTTQ